MKKYLIVGGAGYIGSALAHYLVDNGYHVTVFDNLSTGHKEFIPKKARFIEGSISTDIAKAFVDNSISTQLIKLSNKPMYDAVFHFAAYSQVGESMINLKKYLDENYNNSRILIEECLKNGIDKFVFSSTANIFGNCTDELISETSAINPSSPYGESKLMVENLLKWVKIVNPHFNYSCLRYFNAAGADKASMYGEKHTPETHLIPLVIRATKEGNILKVFGNKYNTPDGTCIRDYIHIDDLATAHFKVLSILKNKSSNYNLGIGKGYSIMDIIKIVEQVSNKKVNYEIVGPRDGDPARLVASNQKFIAETEWIPLNNITDIVQDALSFERSQWLSQ